jgi:hypothetical protein
MIKIRNVTPVLIVGANYGPIGFVVVSHVAYEVRALSVNRNLKMAAAGDAAATAA